MSTRLLRILCLGDSLTSGWCNGGLALHPYSRKLEEKLKTAFPHVKFEIATNGLPGDVVTFERFETRLKSECANSTFDWVIILGGTNDLAYNISASNIYRSLEKLWNIALSRGSKVLALTIPEGRPRPDSVVRRRDEINLKIMTHQAPKYYFYDLESQIPYHSLSEEDRARYWEDGLHLRSDGYDWMGSHIADGLIGILKRENELEPSTSARRPAKQASEESIFCDEENGNPKKINEGYIVVRKRDLD